MNQLTVKDCRLALLRGKSLEQFLGRSHPGAKDGYVRWLEIRPTGASATLIAHDIEDLGREDCLDLYAFPYFDPDSEGQELGKFKDLDAALEFSQAHVFAKLGHWVIQPMVQDDYLSFIRAGRPPLWPSTT